MPDSNVDVVSWKLARPCSMAPAQLAAAYGGLCVLSLSVALFFWVQGARLVMPFACLELLAVGVAFWVYARHAGDAEWVSLRQGKLVIQRCHGGRWSRFEASVSWVVVEISSDARQWVQCRSGEQTVHIGRWVRLERRRVFVRELRSALKSSAAGQQQVSHEATPGKF